MVFSATLVTSSREAPSSAYAPAFLYAKNKPAIPLLLFSSPFFEEVTSL
jgi:hypothetical protein